MPSTRPPRNEPVEPVPPARVLNTGDGLWRIDLFETGRSDVTGRGEIRPYYRAVFVRAADGVTLVADLDKVRDVTVHARRDAIHVQANASGTVRLDIARPIAVTRPSRRGAPTR